MKILYASLLVIAVLLPLDTSADVDVAGDTVTFWFTSAPGEPDDYAVHLWINGITFQYVEVEWVELPGWPTLGFEVPCPPGANVHVWVQACKGDDESDPSEPSDLVRCHPLTDLNGDRTTGMAEAGVWLDALRVQYGRWVSPRGVVE